MKFLKYDIDYNNLPEHIAIIMDGNGRYATAKGLSRTEGHKKGADVLYKLSRFAGEIGIKYLTVYAFSTENWKRPKNEVDAIIKLFHQYVIEFKKFYAERTRIMFIGRRTDLPEDVRNKMEMLEEETKDFEKMTLLIVFSYIFEICQCEITI